MWDCPDSIVEHLHFSPIMVMFQIGLVAEIWSNYEDIGGKSAIQKFNTLQLYRCYNQKDWKWFMYGGVGVMLLKMIRKTTSNAIWLQLKNKQFSSVCFSVWHIIHKTNLCLWIYKINTSAWSSLSVEKNIYIQLKIQKNICNIYNMHERPRSIGLTQGTLRSTTR